MIESDTRRPTEAMSELGISATSLRRWSKEFGRFLSDSAAEALRDEGSQQVVRRYTTDDIRVLARIKELLSQGFTYDHVARRLAAEANGHSEPTNGDAPVIIPERSLARRPADDAASALAPTVKLMSDTLQTLSESQQSILNIQQSNRDLMGVVIQDNFNLKAENTKLRDRMLELEREMSEIRRHGEQERRVLEERLRQLELLVLGEPDRAPTLEPEADGRLSGRAHDAAEMAPTTPAPDGQPKRKGLFSRLVGE